MASQWQNAKDLEIEFCLALNTKEVASRAMIYWHLVIGRDGHVVIPANWHGGFCRLQYLKMVFCYVLVHMVPEYKVCNDGLCVCKCITATYI